MEKCCPHRRLRLEWYRTQMNWIDTEWNEVAFSNESRFNMGSDDNRVRVRRSRGTFPVSILLRFQRYIDPETSALVAYAIAYDTRSPLTLIHGTMTSQRYVRDILQPHVLPLMTGLSGAIFQQNNARPHTARISQDFLHYISNFPWPARSPYLSSIEHI
ncbi:transposable element Tcb2 transposase [Trichonephila clavipes]|nr:transposable element Tcb2 transposase [Trichonephila clavipes]